jgi:hypothetical protein
LKKLISNNNLLIRELKKLEENNFRKSIDTTEGRFGVCRRSVHSIISTFGRYIRTFSAYTRKNEHRQIRKRQRRRRKTQNQKSEVTTEDDINHIKNMMTTTRSL